MWNFIFFWWPILDDSSPCCWKWKPGTLLMKRNYYIADSVPCFYTWYRLYSKRKQANQGSTTLEAFEKRKLVGFPKHCAWFDDPTTTSNKLLSQRSCVHRHLIIPYVMAGTTTISCCRAVMMRRHEIIGCSSGAVRNKMTGSGSYVVWYSSTLNEHQVPKQSLRRT